MAKVLRLYNTFTKSLNVVKLAGKPISPVGCGQLQHPNLLASFYICGPTVYSDCHVGHALTYIRADLFRKFMRSMFNVRLDTVMNITDIDDKILEQTLREHASSSTRTASVQRLPEDPELHPFSKMSDKYFRSFLADLDSLRVLPADLLVKISHQIPLIKAFIGKLERSGHAYISSDGDVRFRVGSLNNYQGRLDLRGEPSSELRQKEDPRDFTLWKAAKPNEPVWLYESKTSEVVIPGRPGWHVQCSAIASALFGDKLDFHFGGKDLIFPHHYNEEACCCAYHDLDTSNSLHVWANNWLHSGHLVVRDSKMSKSLGNVVPIKTFIDRSSVNALRLLCVQSHYRSDIDYNDELLERLKVLDHKISAFHSYLSEEISNVQVSLGIPNNDHHDQEIEQIVIDTHDEIIGGVCDDFHLDTGLDSILKLSKLIQSKGRGNLNPRVLIGSWSLLKDWCNMCGLEYSGSKGTSMQGDITLRLLAEFRHTIRTLTLEEHKKTDDRANREFLNKLLTECDKLRKSVDEFGFVLRDPKS